jgi:preprotein translocase subunit SecG
MLSFLRDQNSEELPAEKKMKAAAVAAGKAAGSKKSAGSKKAADSKATDSKAADSKAADSKAADSKAADSKTSASKTAGINKVLRDDAINSQEPEFLTVSSHGKRVRKTTTLLVVLFIIGLICLVFMIKKSSPKTASASNSPSEDTLVETAIARLTGVKTQMFSRIDEIVGKFYEFSEVPQVKVNELAKNPFELETKTGNIKRGADNEMDARALWQQQLRQNSKGMQLWSIMQTNQGNRCMINDEVLGEGDSIRGFKVTQIGDNFVKLESDGVQIELTLSE